MTRSSYKGLYVAYHLLKKINVLNEQGRKESIKTWSRSSFILPSMIGHTFSIYNGKKHIPLFVSDQQVGHKLGEFVATRTFHSHKKKVERKIKK